MSRLAKILRQQAPTRATSEAPRSFVAFCDWLSVRLTPGQRELVRVAYDGEEPGDSPLARQLFGSIEHVPPVARTVIAIVAGARGGKSYVLVALRLVHLMLTVDLSTLAAGQQAVALIIAPNDKLRAEVLRYARGAVRSKPELERLVTGSDGSDGFGIARDGSVVRFETGVATAGGYGARGRALVGFGLDESAFFHDSSYRINDEEIFRAGAARVMPGGQTIVASTPWAEAGLLYDLHKANFGKPSTALVAHAPTLVLHDSEMTRAIVARERQRDPDNAQREFDARFVTSGTTVFFEASTLDAALTDEPFELEPGDQVAAGGDFGFRSDSSALVLVALRGSMVHVFDGLEERPRDGKPLKPSVTVASFAKRIAGRCAYMMADGHYREAIAEHLEHHDLSYAPAPSQPAEAYVRARMLLREGRVRIHRLEMRDRMVQQLREVQGRPLPGGGMSIIHPRWAKGGHGDIASALVLATWQVSGDALPAPKPELGTKEWEEDAMRRREDEWRARQDAQRDRGARAHWRR